MAKVFLIMVCAILPCGVLLLGNAGRDAAFQRMAMSDSNVLQGIGRTVMADEILPVLDYRANHAYDLINWLWVLLGVVILAFISTLGLHAKAIVLRYFLDVLLPPKGKGNAGRMRANPFRRRTI